MDLPTIDGDFFHSYVKLPEGKWQTCKYDK